MGCAASKLDNEDAVRRCRERRRLINEAVRSRHHMAAAHADYCRSLRLTGSTLCAFAAGEHLSVSDDTPPVLLRSQAPTPIPTPATMPTHRPPPLFSPSPAPTTTSSKSSKLPPTIDVNEGRPQRRNLRPLRPKLPHILSESELSSPGRSLKSNYWYRGGYRPESTYSTTPSQASSSWNWENFYPPSPPDSEYFERKATVMKAQHHLNVEDQESDSGGESDTVRADSEYDFFRPARGNAKDHMEEVETEREEVQCSEWEGHDHDCYSTSSSSPDDDSRRGNEDTRDSDAHPEIRSNSFRRQSPSPPSSPPQPSVKPYNVSGRSEKSFAESRPDEISTDMRMVVRHKELKEIVAAIRKSFDDAASAGEQLSDILEIGRAQLDRSFRNLKKTVYHSSGLLNNLSSNWTSKPPLAVKYKLEADAGGGQRSLLSTVERLLAWEKKLYEDVKAREGVKIAHERKLSTLQNQEYNGDDELKKDKTKASIKRLHSLIIVHSQAVASTSAAITNLRDSDLVPQLVELAHGMMYMWKAMFEYHSMQNVVVQQVRGLVSQPTNGDSTTDLHRLATRDLECAVSGWHSSFCRLMKFQREFVQSIQSWFKLTLYPIGPDNKMDHHDAYSFFDEWKLALDRVPDTVASEAIKSFMNVVHVISVKQTEELKIKRRSEAVSKELEKKSSSLRNIEKKFYRSYSMVGLGLSDSGPENGLGLDDRDPLSEKKSELAACQRRVEEELVKHAKAAEVTRAMTLNNLQTGLPGVFQAMTNFATLFAEVLGVVCTRSYAIK